ncbi:MAG: hypothetical protein J6W96_03225 [Alphaproteobacteria bacterium]|nr:hypothetical protein [Alphaproteobacteria bacterium]
MFGEGGKLIETAIGAMAIGTVARSFFLRINCGGEAQSVFYLKHGC